MTDEIKKVVVAAVREYHGDTVVMSGQAYQTLCLQFSALYEGARKEARELREKNSQMEALISIMSGYMSESLEMFEQMFQSDEGCFPYERMADYVTMATFMEKYTGRKNIVERVKERMSELPF